MSEKNFSNWTEVPTHFDRSGLRSYRFYRDDLSILKRDEINDTLPVQTVPKTGGSLGRFSNKISGLESLSHGVTIARFEADNNVPLIL